MAENRAGDKEMSSKRILEIGNWPPPVCSWSMSLVGLRKELEGRGWECRIMNLNENRRVPSPEYIDVQSGWDYLKKLVRCVLDGCAVHVRVNGEAVKGFIIAALALLAARLFGRRALLTYGGGHHQTYFPAPRFSLRHLAFSLLFRLSERIYCNSAAVKQVLLTTGVSADRLLPIPHTSPYYVEFAPTAMPDEVEAFYSRHEGVFFSYVCFREEFVLEFFAEAIRRFRELYPKVGFFWVGPWEREMTATKEFLRAQNIENDVMAVGSVPHEMFLNMLSRSLGYIRTPITDGVCSSVLESLKIKVPVLGADNGTRPIGTILWEPGSVGSLLEKMVEVVRDHEKIVAQIPEIVIEDNVGKLADDIEEICLGHVRQVGAPGPSGGLQPGQSGDSV
jgi:glycosyltransferase involved in cell wall biosynthesis